MRIEIQKIQYANSTLREDWVFLGGKREIELPIIFCVYLIKTDFKTILVDAGCETMPGFDMKNFISPIKALEQIGVTPNEITDVIITHAHHDHIECVKYFPSATIHLQREELKRARKYIPEAFSLNLFDDSFSICEGVEIVKIGGHSVGSCIVTVKQENTTYVIAGDECYYRECLIQKIPTGNSFSPEKSLAFIQKYSAPHYTVLLMHDD